MSRPATSMAMFLVWGQPTLAVVVGLTVVFVVVMVAIELAARVGATSA